MPWVVQILYKCLFLLFVYNIIGIEIFYPWTKTAVNFSSIDIWKDRCHLSGPALLELCAVVYLCKRRVLTPRRTSSTSVRTSALIAIMRRWKRRFARVATFMAHTRFAMLLLLLMTDWSRPVRPFTHSGFCRMGQMEISLDNIVHSRYISYNGQYVMSRNSGWLGNGVSGVRCALWLLCQWCIPCFFGMLYQLVTWPESTL